jgi:hypothetical protein
MTYFDTQREIDEAQTAIDKAAAAIQAEIAELEAPWTVCRTGLEVIEPPPGDPFTPWRVVLERHGGMEHTVVAVPGATTGSEAISRANAHCRAEHQAYQRAVTDILKSHGVWEIFNKLKRLKEQAKDVLVVLGRLTPEPESPRVINPEAPDEQELARRRLAATNKW